MASSITIAERGVRNNKLWSRGTGNLGNPYAAGGIAVTANQVGMGTIDDLKVELGAAAAGAAAYALKWDATNGKMQAFHCPADAADQPLEEAGAVDLSTYTFRWEAIGH